MLGIGTRVRLDENGWLVPAEANEQSVGVVCGPPNYTTSTVSVSLEGYPNTIQTLAFEQITFDIKEPKSLTSLWRTYTGTKAKRRIRLIAAD